jgi:hypothetical protein
MTTVGLPDQPFSIAGFAFAGNSAAFGGSHLGKPGFPVSDPANYRFTSLLAFFIER